MDKDGADTVLNFNQNESPIKSGDIFQLRCHSHSDKSSKGVITHYSEAYLYLNGKLYMSCVNPNKVTMEYHDFDQTVSKTV